MLRNRNHPGAGKKPSIILWIFFCSLNSRERIGSDLPSNNAAHHQSGKAIALTTAVSTIGGRRVNYFLRGSSVNRHRIGQRVTRQVNREDATVAGSIART